MEDRHWDWLVSSIRYFRALDFFSAQSGLSDEELARQISKSAGVTPFWAKPDQAAESAALSRPDTGDPELDDIIWRSMRPRPDYPDWNLVALDSARVWWEDGEGDIHPGDGVYIRTLQEWSRISRGAFLPTDIREIWEKAKQWPDCKVTVRFLLNGKKKVFEPWDSYGWIDYTLTEGINEMIAKTGFCYEAFDTQDQTTGLVVLTAKEKHRLVEERSWKFSGDAA